MPVALALAAFAPPSPASAEPMAIQPVTQETLAVSIRQHARPRVLPLYSSGLETPFDEQSWRESTTVGFDDRPEVPTGIIASIGRLGLAVDSSEGGPKIKGIAWSPSRSVSVIAGGNLGGGGLGASLSVRLGF